jgi:hypothetical protein
MMKHGLILLLACLFLMASSVQAADWKAVNCEGHYRHHLQGVCVSGEHIYWSFTTTLVKSDVAGKVLKTIEVANHHGDMCAADGKLYVAVNLGKFNQPPGKADSWVYVYDADSLAELARHETQEAVHGAGGMGVRDGKFYIVGGLPEGYEENYVFEYDAAFRFQKKHVIPSGYTRLGIQTATFANDRWYFGCYGNVLLITDADFKLLGRYDYNCSLGIEPLPGGRFFSATGKNHPGMGHTGTVHIAVPDAKQGLKIVESP